MSIQPTQVTTKTGVLESGQLKGGFADKAVKIAPRHHAQHDPVNENKNRIDFENGDLVFFTKLDGEWNANIITSGREWKGTQDKLKQRIGDIQDRAQPEVLAVYKEAYGLLEIKNGSAKPVARASAPTNG